LPPRAGAFDARVTALTRGRVRRRIYYHPIVPTEPLLATPTISVRDAAAPTTDAPRDLGSGLFAGLLVLMAFAILGVLWWRDVIRPGSFDRLLGRVPSSATPNQTDDDPSTSTNGAPALVAPLASPPDLVRLQTRGAAFTPAWWFIGAGAVFFLGLLSAIVAYALTLGVLAPEPPIVPGQPPTTKQQGLMIGLTYALALPAAWLLWRALRPLSDTTPLVGPGHPPGAGHPRELAWRWLGRGGAIYGLLASLIIIPIMIGLSAGITRMVALLNAEAPPAVAHDTLKIIATNIDSPWAWAIIVAVVVGAPAIEELMYRGYLQSGVLRATGSRWFAILLTSAVFAVAHAGMSANTGALMVGLPVLFCFGLALGVVMERGASITACIVVHALFNASQIALVRLVV
jgi:membrane protease YdiL (CAAX protease family)